MMEYFSNKIIRSSNYLKLLIEQKKCIVKWSENEETTNNIGDALNPYLFKAIFGKEVVNFSKTLNTGFLPVYAFVGSVLDNSAVRNLHILGSGFRNEKSTIITKPAKVFACRGPLTREKLMKLGIAVPEIYGDPSILLPQNLNFEVKKTKRMGIIPHYVDRDLKMVLDYQLDDTTKFIDDFSPLEKFIRDVKSCDFTISSSLHGLIISQIYGTPSVWVKFSNNVGGGNFKFQDYYKSLDLDVVPMSLTSNKISIDNLEELAIVPEFSQLQNKLIENFKKII